MQKRLDELTKRVAQLEQTVKTPPPELTDEQLDLILNVLNEATKEYSAYEYGLPLFQPNWKSYAREQVRKALRGQAAG